MTHVVKKSVATVLGDFQGRVDKFASELSAWAAHMQRVATDAGNLKLKPEERHAPYPRPTAHPDVEMSVNENFQADFSIADDGPTEDEVLSAKKNELYSRVSAAEKEAIDAVEHPAKRRFFNIRRAEVAKADKKAAEAAVRSKSNLDQDGLDKAIKKARKKEDADFIAQSDARQARIDEIIRAAAKMHHDIEDLTIDTIDSWKMDKL